MANFELFTARDIAQQLGITRIRVLKIAQTHNIGHMFGNQKLFTKEDIESMRVRRNGRPPKV